MGLRGTAVSLSFILISAYDIRGSVNVTFFDNDCQVVFNSQVVPNVTESIVISLDACLTLGLHRLNATINNAPFMLIGVSQLDITVLGTISCTILAGSAFYGEFLNLSLDLQDDANNTPAIINLTLMSGETLILALSDLHFDTSLLVPLPLTLRPGIHLLTVSIGGPWLISANRTVSVTVWMRTRITIQIAGTATVPTSVPQTEPSYSPDTALSISCGSIIRPPPILFNETVSATPAAARETSPAICPRFISGTSNLSTLSANERTTSSGNGHIVLSRIDRNTPGPELIIASSTDLDVHPKEITPHFASAGPSTTTSVN
jgi:hypothetical protein